MAQASPSLTFTVNPNIFEKCAPALKSNIKQCGSVVRCDAKPITADEFQTVFLRSGDFRIMDALFKADFEIGMCEVVQQGLYQFLMANKVNVSRKMSSRRVNSGLTEIAPFVLARQYSPINDEYWTISSVTNPSATTIHCHARSTTNIPADIRYFPADSVVFIQTLCTGGTVSHTAWKVVSATLSTGGTYVHLVLESQNDGSYLPADKVDADLSEMAEGTLGLLTLGTNNIHNKEKWCSEYPAIINWKNVPFWIQTSRWSTCRSSTYDQWRSYLMQGNPLYQEFFDLDEIEKNRQLSLSWQKRFVRTFFSNKPLPNQNMNDYDQLEPITSYTDLLGWDNTGQAQQSIFGADGGNCIGYRANAVGLYEQMAQCGRIADCQGLQLNLPALWDALYLMMRVRKGRNNPNPGEFDLFMDTVTAAQFNKAMIKYYNSFSDGMARLNINGEGFQLAKRANFGFNYRTYPLFWPEGVVINVVTHEFFDDYLSASATAGQGGASRVIWILDFTGIYPGILASKRVEARTGDLAAMARLNTSYACVMEVDTMDQTLNSLTFTIVLECPGANLIIENFSDEVPEHAVKVGAYPSTSATTTTTEINDIL